MCHSLKEIKIEANKKAMNNDNVVRPAHNFTKIIRPTILRSWRHYTPQQVLSLFRHQYPNINTLSVMVSRMKKDLAGLPDPPHAAYLSEIALTKQEYRAIRARATDSRQRGALNVQVIANTDDIMMQALRYLDSDDPKLVLAAIFPLTGLRPIEVVKIAQFSAKLNQKQTHPAFWACQTQFAKRGTRKARGTDCRDRCFLAPFGHIERALQIIRARWPAQHLTSVQVNAKYCKEFQRILQQCYPSVPGANAKLFRRFFAVCAYKYFGQAAFLAKASSQSSLVGFASWMLGHANLEDQVLAYTSLVLEPAPKVDLFRNFKPKEWEGKSHTPVEKGS